MRYSAHAGKRIQQRGRPKLIVDWLAAKGRSAYMHDGTVIKYFDRRAKTRFKRELGGLVAKRLNDLLDTYIIVDISTETIITVGVRYRPVKYD